MRFLRVRSDDDVDDGDDGDDENDSENNWLIIISILIFYLLPIKYSLLDKWRKAKKLSSIARQ